MDNIHILPVKHSKYSVFVAFLLLCSPVLLLLSCDREDIHRQIIPVLPEGEEIIVNFTLDMIEFGDNEVVTRIASPTNPSEGGASFSPFGGVRGGFEETVVIPLKDNLCLSATLIEDTNPVNLRAVTLPKNGSKVRIVEYLTTSTDTVYVNHADYEVTGALLTLTSGTHLSATPGLTYKFVAYSFNDLNTLPAHSEIPFQISSLSDDVLWGNTTITIPNSSFSLHITMKHLQSKVILNAATDFGGTNTLNSVNADIYCYNTPELTVKTGVLSPSGSLTSKPFSWSITDPLLTSQTSNSLRVFTANNNSIRLRINQMRINYLTFDDPVEIVFHKPLEAGKSYELQVHFMWARGGSADRITWDNNNGKYAITRDPTDAGLYFKFGSVVGIYSNAGSVLALPGQTNDNDTVFVGARDVAWHPFSSNITTWGGVPAYSNSDYPQMVTPEDNYHTIANVKAGKGDPCRLVGLDLNKIRNTAAGSLTYADIDNGKWRLPTFQDNEWFADNAIPSSTLHFWDLASGANPSPFGPYVAGGEFPQRGNAVLTEEGRKARFLPAAGCRRASSGNVIRVTQGVVGYFWANESFLNGFSIPDGNLFFFAPVAVLLYPLALPNDIPLHDDINWGFSVRCVRQSLNIEVSLEPWDNGGNLNINGEGNIIL